MLSALVLLGLLNGLFFLPILLSLVGPPAEVIPADGEERLATPTPEPSPYVERSGRMHSGAGGPGKVRIDSTGSAGGSTGTGNPSVTYVPRRLRGSDLSLTTITEEPPSWTSSHEIVVQPEVVVETTTCNGSGGCASNRHSSSDQVKIPLFSPPNFASTKSRFSMKFYRVRPASAARANRLHRRWPVTAAPSAAEAAEAVPPPPQRRQRQRRTSPPK